MRYLPLVLILTASAAFAETVIPIPNGSFEDGLTGWDVKGEKVPMSTLSTAQAAAGKQSLKTVDASKADGSGAAATPVAVKPGQYYELLLKYFPVSGSGLGVYVKQLDAAGQDVTGEDAHLRGLGGTQQTWQDVRLGFTTQEQAAKVQVYFHSYMAAEVVGYVDDLNLVSYEATDFKPLWEPQYKLRATDKARLTAADVVGPDGVVYPNWTKCGVQGGIPQVQEFVTLEAFGGKADDGQDDSAALSAACDAAGYDGGGAVVLGPGTYHLDDFVAVRRSGVVIRGAGRDKTRIVFRYALPPSGISFYGLKPGANLGPNTPVELHALPTGLMKMTIAVDGQVVATWTRSLHSGNTFKFSTPGRNVLAKVPDGSHTLQGTAEYEGGQKRELNLPITTDKEQVYTNPWPMTSYAIAFSGQGQVGPKLLLAEDGKRGAFTLKLKSTEGLTVGDKVLLEAPATPRWKTLTRNACQWGTYRRYWALIERLEGDTITLNQPLRIEFPAVDESYVQKFVPVERCGVEDLSIEQTENLWISTVFFRNAWNCWARGVTVKKCGQNPVYAGNAKWCEIRDCVFDDAWFKGGGGTAYGGWENCSDCLMDGIETFNLRHAPLFQWAASGNVIRNGVFHNSDGQWHSGWTNENLFENCVITSVSGNGGYGYGLWASPPEDEAHGPNGPRNVIYNCDVSSEKAGLWMGGMNENWLVLYNRFVAKTGPGVFAKTFSFDHVIRGNTFILQDPKQPMVFLGTPDCLGLELTANKLLGGNGKPLGGPAQALLTDNQALPLGEAPRPTPPAPSIYQWQLDHCR